MSADLSFTGERFLPSCEGEIAYEHWHRYAFARDHQVCRGSPAELQCFLQAMLLAGFEQAAVSALRDQQGNFLR